MRFLRMAYALCAYNAQYANVVPLPTKGFPAFQRGNPHRGSDVGRTSCDIAIPTTRECRTDRLNSDS